MSEVIKKVRSILKDEKIMYTIEEEHIILEMGTFNGGIQFEKHDHEDDYTILQTWVMREDNEDDDIDHHDYDSISLDDLEDIVNELIDSVRNVNGGISKINKKLNEIIQIAKSYEIQSSLLSDIVSNIIGDYE